MTPAQRQIVAIEARCQRELDRLGKLYDRARRIALGPGESRKMRIKRWRAWDMAAVFRKLHFEVDALRREIRDLKIRIANDQ